MSVTPYMLMDLPVVSATLGPAWASKINAALSLNDAHDHSSGKGVPVRPVGMYMDSDLDFLGTNPKNARSMRFQLQTFLLGGITDVCCVYFKGADLYCNDAAGNQIQLTSGGGIVGTSGSISGLVSPASAVYTPATKLFKFYSDSNVWAAIRGGPLTISDAILNGKGVTISVPSGLSPDYALELPAALPASTKPLTVSTVGKIAAADEIVVAASTTNSHAVTATGNGYGSGINAFGGTYGAPGVVGIGGISGTGVQGNGGGPNASGGGFNGIGTGAGVTGVGGDYGVGGDFFSQLVGTPVRGAIRLYPQASPSAPQNGDMWVETGTNTLKVRINGATKTVTLT